MNYKSPLLWFTLSFIAVAAITLVSPPEATLGSNVRIVYLHGAWVWASLATFIAAALVGLIALLLRRENLQRWSRALGRTGLVFWITYLPLSLWAMQANWNGLFLSEPRWRFALVFSITGLLLQLGLSFLPLIWSSVGNIAYVIALFVVMANTENVMHPPSPMLDSDFGRIQIFFGALTLLLLFAAFQMARGFLKMDGSGPKTE
ncbi:MAG TPA: hypothetical protein DEH25_01475 [Chloroflexi bacterium]|nr:hypothetical protein [Chloroflexota bacterium]